MVRNLILAGVVFILSSCASTTTISVSPRSAEARVFADGRFIGNAPAQLRDAKISGAGTLITIESEGYEDFRAYIEKSDHINVSALVGGIFSFGIGYIWIMGYDPYYEFFLVKDETTSQTE